MGQIVIFSNTIMDSYFIDSFYKFCTEKCKGKESSPVGSPRQKSFCGRMCGHKKKNTGKESKKDPDSCINQALRRWKCRCSNDDSISQLIVAESLLDNFIGTRTAQEKMDEEACEILSNYVAFTRALYLLHQQNHWKTQRYGDHLLFQRLYEDAQELADDAAERAMGICGDVDFKGKEAEITQKFAPEEASILNCLKSSLSIEKAFQEICKTTYDALKEKNALTLGLDDLITAQASKGEVHLYLLQQGLRGLE